MKKLFLSLLLSAQVFTGVSYIDRIESYPYDKPSIILCEVIKSYFEQLENIDMALRLIEESLSNKEFPSGCKKYLIDNRFYWLRLKLDLYTMMRSSHDLMRWVDQDRFEKYLIESEEYFKDYQDMINTLE